VRKGGKGKSKLEKIFLLKYTGIKPKTELAQEIQKDGVEGSAENNLTTTRRKRRPIRKKIAISEILPPDERKANRVCREIRKGEKGTKEREPCVVSEECKEKIPKQKQDDAVT